MPCPRSSDLLQIESFKFVLLSFELSSCHQVVNKSCIRESLRRRTSWQESKVHHLPLSKVNKISRKCAWKCMPLTLLCIYMSSELGIWIQNVRILWEFMHHVCRWDSGWVWDPRFFRELSVSQELASSVPKITSTGHLVVPVWRCIWDLIGTRSLRVYKYYFCTCICQYCFEILFH